MAHLKMNNNKDGFKVETITDLPNILTPDMLMFKLELTAGYFNMLVRRFMRRLFGSTFEGVGTEAITAPLASAAAPAGCTSSPGRSVPATDCKAWL
jgi:hypothetical protein